MSDLNQEDVIESSATMESEKKEVRKGKVLINLEHSEKGIKVEVEAPKKIKMGFFTTFIELRYGLPPMDISPIDWKGMAFLLIPFFWLVGIGGLSQNVAFIVVGLILVAYNFYITKNYFFDYITRKLSEGFECKNPEEQKVLETAGIEKKSLEEIKKREKVQWIVFGSLALLSLLTLPFGSTL